MVLTLSTGRRVTVAERFRRARYARYDDITLRHSSLATGRKLEAAGVGAQYLLYAVVNAEETGFLRWDLVYTAKLMELAERLALQAVANTNGSSRFVAVPRAELFACGAVAASSAPLRAPASREAPGR